MTDYRYRPSALKGDYARTGVGLALTGGPLLVVDAGLVGTIILGLLAALFVVFGGRTALRQAMRVRIDDDGIATVGPIQRRIRWPELASADLTYYTTKRDGGAGWMQLKLKGDRGTLRIESSLDGFVEVVRKVAAVADANCIELAPATINNMQALGVATDRASRSVRPNGRSSISPRS